MERATIIGLIKNLSNKTIDKGATEAEANSAMNKIDQLMRTYNLTLDQVFIEHADYRKYTITTDSRNSTAICSCMVGIATFCDCKVWRTHENGNVAYCFFGMETDIHLASYLYTVIDRAIETETEKFKQSPEYTQRHGHGRGYVSSFQKGMASRIYHRLQAMHDVRMQDEQRPIASCGTSIIVLKNRRLKDEFEKIGLRLTNRRSSSRISRGGAYASGKEAGDRVNLNRPLAGSSVSGYLT